MLGVLVGAQTQIRLTLSYQPTVRWPTTPSSWRISMSCGSVGHVRWMPQFGTGERVSAPQSTTEYGYDEYSTYSKYSTYSSVDCLVGFAVSAMATQQGGPRSDRCRRSGAVRGRRRALSTPRSFRRAWARHL